MKKWLCLFLLAAPVAAEQQPPHGTFDWKSLAGKYRFVECSSEGRRQWSSDPSDPRFRTDYIGIEARTDYTVSPWNDMLDLYRQNDVLSPIAPGWTLEHLNQGKVERHNPQDWSVTGWHDTWTTLDGVYGVLAWDGDNRATLRLIVNGNGAVSYVMTTHRVGEAEQTERCSLRRDAGPLPR